MWLLMQQTSHFFEFPPARFSDVLVWAGAIVTNTIAKLCVLKDMH